VTEPLTQAERDVVYAIWRFERFKKNFAVRVASEYLRVLELADRAENSRGSYERLIRSSRRARRLADAGILPEIQVDQSVQSELRARDRWITAEQSHASALDAFKVDLGLPPDAAVALDHEELQRLAEGERAQLAGAASTQPTGPVPPADAPVDIAPPTREGAGPYELDPAFAVAYALEHRLDLNVVEGQVYDAQRQVVVAANGFLPDLTVGGTAAVGARRPAGSAGSPDAGNLRPDQGRYSALLTLDLPLERTRERNAYRLSYIALERAVRDLQALEDQVKLDVRDRLRDLLEARESLRIQAESVALAERRVASTDLFLQAGRAQIRDVLEAQEALLEAQDAFTSALVDYRVAELSMQRDTELLQVNHDGLVSETLPAEPAPAGATPAGPEAASGGAADQASGAGPGNS
jgi:outer membrane protein TolC